MASNTVRIFEVGPRDGLQNQSERVSTARKVELVDLLSDTGLDRIEVTAFVSPKWIPQLSDGSEVLASIHRNPNVRYSALTPNLKGYFEAHDAGVDEVAVFTTASESFCQHNIHCSICESFERFEPVLDAAKKDGIPVRGYVSCVIACPYEGVIEPKNVAKISKALLEIGCSEISLGDTIGAGTTQTIAKMLEAVVEVIPADKLAGHYHDTGDKALANIEESLRFGLRTFDTAVGGLGGCPYAPGAKGNVDTRLVIKRLSKLGYETHIDLDKLKAAEEFALTIKHEGKAA